MERAGYLEENYHYFHLRDTAGQERDFHFHEFDKLVLLLEGKVSYLVENEDYILRPHDLLLVRHHCIHKAVIDRSEPYDRVILYLDRHFFSRLFPDAGLMESFDHADRIGRHLLVPGPDQWRQLEGLIRSIEENDTEDPLTQAMRDTLIVQLLVLISRFHSESGRDAAVLDPKIQESLSYITEHLSEELSVDLLSERVYLSRYHFMRLFRAQTGQSVHAYIREKRLLRAARLIRDGASAADAAEKCGYSDYSGFHRAFVSSFGCTPGTLKNN